MLDAGVEAREQRGQDGDRVPFWQTGAKAKGEFHCAECGYGVVVQTRLPTCPMCGAGSWEQSAWSPITRARGYTL